MEGARVRTDKDRQEDSRQATGRRGKMRRDPINLGARERDIDKQPQDCLPERVTDWTTDRFTQEKDATDTRRNRHNMADREKLAHNAESRDRLFAAHLYRRALVSCFAHQVGLGVFCC